ncbi:uncharacterized protein LOC123988104 [Osmia bicornis bicornis]|uniref:uncharacterized protein LOC123988104 n=3 Tax=Osmia bicornis bicornis TaxID=1437191 RepID=UPI001EAECC79|nr:uncharacterized protein LOC123988104 [Osmia bicornis bicornis]
MGLTSTHTRQNTTARSLVVRSRLGRTAFSPPGGVVASVSSRSGRDDCGIIRVGGRLDHASLTYDQRHPILVHRRSNLAELIVRAAHAQTLHGGLTSTQSFVRQTYWIPQDRTLLKRILRNCVRCVRFQGNTGTQQMGSLPASRVQPARAFLRSGVDYAGPITLCMSKGRGQKTVKGYIAVFVCLCTKAVHLEPVSDLSASAFIAAFRRFVARRGRCAHLLSDNATNFRGADAQLKSMFKRASEFYREVAELIANEGTNWEFIPPYSPHFGGLWEAAVKSAKRHLLRSVEGHRLTFEELTTLLCQVEACLNSRPLSPLTDDPKDFSALTPNHLITGHSLSAIPESPENLNFDGGHKRWALVQKLIEHFWRRWSKEYLGQLQHLPKWRKALPNLQLGTLVLLKEDSTPPTKWPMARVVKVHEGKDGLTRVATVQTATRLTTRAITRLIPLVSPNDTDNATAKKTSHDTSVTAGGGTLPADEQ